MQHHGHGHHQHEVYPHVPVEARPAEAVDQVDRGLEPQHLRKPEERLAVRRPVPVRARRIEPSLSIYWEGSEATPWMITGEHH